MELHQRANNGNTAIMQYMLDWYRPPNCFENTLWMSQILQGMAIKYAVEHWRRSMPRGMGTLYWQINDCWPVASWSSIDYFGRLKALHYMARHFFAPVLISGLEDLEHGVVSIHLTNDRREPVAGKVRWTVTDVNGKLVRSGACRATAAPLANTPVCDIRLQPVLARYKAYEILVWLEFIPEEGTGSENLVLLARPKHLELRKPGIQPVVQSLENGSFSVTLKSSAPALWCWLDLAGREARYSDNFVHVRPGTRKQLVVTPVGSMTESAFKRALCVRSLVDTY